MIQEVEGDILLTKAGAVAHGVAPHDNFANGLALALRERWPAMYKDFKHACHVSEPKSGELWTWSGVGGCTLSISSRRSHRQITEVDQEKPRWKT